MRDVFLESCRGCDDCQEDDCAQHKDDHHDEHDPVHTLDNDKVLIDVGKVWRCASLNAISARASVGGILELKNLRWIIFWEMSPVFGATMCLTQGIRAEGIFENYVT